MNLFDLTGRKAIVTGGSRGLGHAMAEGLLEAGCEVCIVSGSERVIAAAEEYRMRGLPCCWVRADLRSERQAAACIAQCEAALGGTAQILVAAHGIQRRGLAEDFPLETWDEVMQVNLRSVFALCQQAAKRMIPQKYGKIILISSMSAFFGGTKIPAYAVSKAGVTELAKALSNEWLPHGINVNCLAPGFMATDLCADLQKSDQNENILRRIPAGRWGTPQDMKGPCVFLASDASNYLGGAVIPVDGGYLVG